MLALELLGVCTTTYQDLLDKDGSLTFHHRNIHQVAIEMFKVKHGLSPPFMKDIFNHSGNCKGTRSGDTFARPNIDSVKKGERSLRNYRPIVWNTLLPEKEFKFSIKSWIPENCPCELCRTYVQGLGYVDIFE